MATSQEHLNDMIGDLNLHLTSLIQEYAKRGININISRVSSTEAEPIWLVSQDFTMGIVRTESGHYYVCLSRWAANSTIRQSFHHNALAAVKKLNEWICDRQRQEIEDEINISQKNPRVEKILSV